MLVLQITSVIVVGDLDVEQHRLRAGLVDNLRVTINSEDEGICGIALLLEHRNSTFRILAGRAVLQHRSSTTRRDNRPDRFPQSPLAVFAASPDAA
jgi:hypothetical protein